MTFTVLFHFFIPWTFVIALTIWGAKLSEGSSDAQLSAKTLTYRLAHYSVQPIYLLVKNLGLKPSQVTTLGFVITLGAGFLFMMPKEFWNVVTFVDAGWLICWGGMFDFIDGMLAKRNHLSSRAGGFYDSVMDRFSEAVLFVALALFYRDTPWLVFVLLAFMGAMLTSYCRSAGEKWGASCQKGLLQRPGRVVILGLGAVFTPLIAYSLHFALPQHYDFSFEECRMIYGFMIAVLAILANVTAIQRTILIYRELKN